MVTMELVINTSENFCISIVSSGFCTELGVRMDSSLLLHASNEKFSYLMSKDLRCSKRFVERFLVRIKRVLCQRAYGADLHTESQHESLEA